MIAITCGTIIAPPRPWTARDPISMGMSRASPQTADASVNSPTPHRNSRLRPSLSPNRPNGSSPAAKAST